MGRQRLPGIGEPGAARATHDERDAPLALGPGHLTGDCGWRDSELGGRAGQGTVSADEREHTQLFRFDPHQEILMLHIIDVTSLTSGSSEDSVT
ncbi:hypothetical protein GCM10028802_36600 [Terrabacter terrigena]